MGLSGLLNDRKQQIGQNKMAKMVGGEQGFDALS